MRALRGWAMVSLCVLAIVLVALPLVVKSSFAIDIFIRCCCFRSSASPGT